MTLIKRVRKALEFDETEAKDAAARRYEGLKDNGVHVVTYQVEAARWEHARTAKLVEALVKCADVIVCTTSNEYGFSVSDYSKDAIAQLELALKKWRTNETA